MNNLSLHNSELRQPKHDKETKIIKYDKNFKTEYISPEYDLDKLKIRFEKAIKIDVTSDYKTSNEVLDSEMIVSPFKALNQYGLKEIDSDEPLKYLGLIKDEILTDAVNNVITNRPKEEKSINEVVIMGDNILNSMGSRGTVNLTTDQSNSKVLVSKADLSKTIVAEILPKFSSVSDKQEIIIRFQIKDSNQLEIKVSRQGSELSVIVKTANIDVYNQVSNARQDIQYSLESKLPNIMVRIDMDLTDQSDREGKGYYFLPDEDEL
ncbi:MAG: hypothetical protein ACI843_000287 [Psychrobacter glaciei]|jgi:hypothetical protein